MANGMDLGDEATATASTPATRERVRRAPVATSTAVAETPVPVPAAASDPERPAEVDLDRAELYLNRELTWLGFNRRVLYEAHDDANPLLERVKFLSITASNLDEFFMKRIGGLKHQASAGMQDLTVDGRTPQQQIQECYALVRELEAEQRALLPELLSLLRQHDVALVSYDELTSAEQEALREHYCKNVYPLVTPQAMDPAHPFPFVSNLSLNLLVTLRYPDDDDHLMARVKVPVGGGIPRFLRVGREARFVPLEEVMARNLDLLFPNMVVVACEQFRVTRNANTERDEEEADDLLALIESELQQRRLAPIVRLEVSRDMSALHRGMLASELELDENDDVFDVEGMLGLRDLMEIAALEVPALRDAPHRPVDHPRLPGSRNIFHILRGAGSLLLHHPYHSYQTSVERLLFEASQDPKVRAIKMTLYRTSSDSKILDYLCDAARNGKQVTVVVELKARFDEAANIQFASRLEDYGIHVTYGVVGLKTHSKVILVVRQDYTGLRRYAHIGTGNYHAGTARLYTDLGLLTCDDQIGQDLTELFNYLTTGYRPKRAYRKLLPAPTLLKKALLAKIEREIVVHQKSGSGLIQFKMNALEDADIARALYRASIAGVHVDLIVRDTCRLRAGLPGISQNIRVVSVIGRFLEHARIYYFHNGGAEECFIGSADCMKRNLESRVEVVVPVEDPALRRELRSILEIQLGNNQQLWEMQPDGTYVRSAGGAYRSCQQQLIEIAEKQHKEAGRLRKRRPKGFSRAAKREA